MLKTVACLWLLSILLHDGCHGNDKREAGDNLVLFHPTATLMASRLKACHH